jgi:hypothetical protein
MSRNDSWVERRDTCTLEGIIELLREIFATDVRKLNELNLRDITFRSMSTTKTNCTYCVREG